MSTLFWFILAAVVLSIVADFLVRKLIDRDVCDCDVSNQGRECKNCVPPRLPR